MGQEQLRHASERGDGEPFAACDDDVFAQLQRAAREADDHQRLEDSALRSPELVTVDHRDAEHELDLLLEGEQRLAGDGADRQQRAEARSDRGGAAYGAGRRHTPSGGTDERVSELIVGEKRIGGPQVLDPGPDGRLSGSDGLVQ